MFEIKVVAFEVYNPPPVCRMIFQIFPTRNVLGWLIKRYTLGDRSVRFFDLKFDVGILDIIEC